MDAVNGSEASTPIEAAPANANHDDSVAVTTEVCFIKKFVVF